MEARKQQDFKEHAYVDSMRKLQYSCPLQKKRLMRKKLKLVQEQSNTVIEKLTPQIVL